MKSTSKILVIIFAASFEPGLVSCSKSADELLAEDRKTLNGDLAEMDPRKFREALDRYTPLTELSVEPKSPAFKEQIRQMSIRAEGMERSSNGVLCVEAESYGAFCRYLFIVLLFECPQSEKDIFCDFMEALLGLHVESPHDGHFSGLLSATFNDAWLGWHGGPNGWPNHNAAKKAWHESELYQYLKHKRLPKSEILRTRILLAECYKWKFATPEML